MALEFFLSFFRLNSCRSLLGLVLALGGIDAAFADRTPARVPPLVLPTLEPDVARFSRLLSLTPSRKSEATHATLEELLSDRPSRSHRLTRQMFHVCGGISLSELVPPKFWPSETTSLLTEAYRGCTSVEVELGPGVVPQRTPPMFPLPAETSDEPGWLDNDESIVREARLRELFTLLLEAVTLANRDQDEWMFWDLGGATVAEVRTTIDFHPGIRFTLTGATPLLVEIDCNTRRLLVASGEKWDTCVLDAPTTLGLADLAGASVPEFSEPRLPDL